MTSRWDSYLCRVNDALASVFVDLGVRDQAPIPSQPWLLWIWVKMTSPRPDGLSSNEESRVLNQLGDALEAAVSTDLGGRYVGRITTSGRREFYFYSASPALLDHVATTAVAAFPGYEVTAGSKLDDGWTQYFRVLHPSDDELERMKNRRLIEMLEKEGDVLKTRRPVDHWLKFAKGGDIAAVVREAGAFGFASVGTPSDPEDADDGRVSIQLQREDAVTPDAINAATLQLLKLARKFGGEYDGWESPVVKDA